MVQVEAIPLPQRKIERDEVDPRMVRALADMPTNLAEEALARYSRSVDGHVRSRQGFMVSPGEGRDRGWGAQGEERREEVEGVWRCLQAAWGGTQAPLPQLHGRASLCHVRPCGS